jgi:transposase
VSCDDAEWITRPVAERCPTAVIALDPFHIVKAATDALDEIRREIWNEARRAGNKQLAKDLKGARFALWKNAENLTDRQQHKLSSIQQTNHRTACQRWRAPLGRSVSLDRVVSSRASRLKELIRGLGSSARHAIESSPNSGGTSGR